jgi:ankyrin repeat protein
MMNLESSARVLVGMVTLGVFLGISFATLSKGEMSVNKKGSGAPGMDEASAAAQDGQKRDDLQWTFHTPGETNQQSSNSEQSSALLTTGELLAYEEAARNAARMWEAVRRGDTALIRELVANGVDVNEKDNEDLTPLHQAAYQDQVAVIEQLLDCGADINAKDLYGYTPLILATRSGNAGVVNLLLGRGADPNVEADDNSSEAKSKTTALKIAIQNGNSEIIKLLRNHGTLR